MESVQVNNAEGYLCANIEVGSRCEEVLTRLGVDRPLLDKDKFAVALDAPLTAERGPYVAPNSPRHYQQEGKPIFLLLLVMLNNIAMAAKSPVSV